jgi:hypothetical protein
MRIKESNRSPGGDCTPRGFGDDPYRYSPNKEDGVGQRSTDTSCVIPPDSLTRFTGVEEGSVIDEEIEKLGKLNLLNASARYELVNAHSMLLDFYLKVIHHFQIP